ncbi:UDP-3-O-(3-hydroxymyristoyl)glucosamine N-acyltransferase [Halioglobus maricola]|uniref:UDP-3-O-acylglucosamine N-acyltransferase n=1 Tax=Halioglobus maricola TaxID=2601894 RepID=A0A5P9NLI3_9GAMM|nr:UDP-3-O-(3-hydroxymyristoyl)glucosamine N-acyltransferase [Halioglobus maricola]QFU76681.1 UDP-3-O-(3-hydroxymyristoyl)glucosamine N-acyltransferase [Halioglobus maricola]
MVTLGELAERFDLVLSGDPQRPVSGLGTLANAGPEQVTFLSNPRFQSLLGEARAAAVILRADIAADCPVDTLVTDDPYLAFARMTAIFDQTPRVPGGIHPSALVAADAIIGEGSCIGPNVVVESGVIIGDGCQLAANVYVGEHSVIGANSHLMPGVVIYHDVHLGERCKIHGQSVIGSDGFGFAPKADGWQKIHQLGGVRVGDDVEIGAGVTIDRGALEHTVLEDGVILDNQVHIAHNCRIGKNTAIAGCTGMAGSSIIGANCTLAGMVGVAGHLEICDGVHVSGMTMVTKSITTPGSYSSGTPMMPSRGWRRAAVRFSQLERIHQRLAALESEQGQ